MNPNPFFKNICTIIFLSVCFSQLHSQNKKDDPFAFFYQFRGDNVITGALGNAIMNGDYPDPIFEFYGQIGYKRYINPYVNINFTYNKFNLAYKENGNNGYMSFDLNVEGTIMPNSYFMPFVFAGAGFNAANYFTQTGVKVQGGFGIERIIMEGFGLKLFTDYNQTFSDELEGKIYGDSNDVYWRIGFGVNYYFGKNKNQKKKKTPIDDGEPTIIKSNPIIHD